MPPIARRIGTKAAGWSDRSTAWAVARSRGAWTLRIAPLLLVFPLLFGLVAGNVLKVVGLVAALALFWVAVRLIREGYRAEADYHAREVAQAPRLPRKLLGAAAAGLAAFVAAFVAARSGLPLSLLMGVVMGTGTVLAYGRDPSVDKGLDPQIAARAGLRTEQVIETIAEAEAKVAEIERFAAELRSHELVTRLRRIADQARAVLRQLERDPSDLHRARRFLVTYLDGTRDVVRKYAEQQHDLANTPLALNFRRVLDTVERVFVEQEQVLKKHESLDLEVQIDVLHTQLDREGVH